jgi:predicted nuclease of restriction endonuclease-like (RecB) superfamily
MTSLKRMKKETAIYRRIREILESAKAGVARTVNSTQVVANWLIGREIVEEEQRGLKRAGYGEKLIHDLAERLTKEFGRGYSEDNLFWFRRFYGTYPELLRATKFDAVRQISRPLGIIDAARQISGPSAGKQFDAAGGGSDERGHRQAGSTLEPGLLHANLSWTHYRTLLRVESAQNRAFYEIEAIKNNWSARELERQINSLLFERLAKSKDKAGLMRMAAKGQEIQSPADVFKDPVVIEFLGLPESPRLVESDLEQALINNLQLFLLELGKGFAFVSRQERITLDGDHFYIDLVFYHTVLKCFVLIDLKVGKLSHGDLGQLQLYVNYFDQERRTAGDGPTLGLILCTDKNDAVVKYTLGPEQEKKIFTSRYKLHLPSETELKAEIRRELKQFGNP